MKKSSLINLKVQIFKKMKIQSTSVLMIFIIFFLVACDSKPKVIVEDASNTTSMSSDDYVQTNTGMQVAPTTGTNDLHQVVVNEILQTEKYTYLKVIENNKDTFLDCCFKTGEC